MTCITDEQRKLHVAAEGAALLLAVPLLMLVGNQRQLHPGLRAGAIGLAVGTFLVDGCLLSRYLRVQ